MAVLEPVRLNCPACAAPILLPLTQQGADLTSITLAIDLNALRRHIATEHPQEPVVPDKPSIGRIVHYVSFGTPGGEYGKECRAAVITELTGDPDHPDQVGLAVLNPTGMFFNRAVSYHDGGETPGAPDCPNSASHGAPFRYCACGWIEASHIGGTWHWPERTV